MAGGIGQEELLGGGCVAADMEKDAADAIWGMDHGLVDRAGLGGMLVSHLEGIVGEFVVGVARPLRMAGNRSDLLIADIDPCPELGEVNVDPIGVLRYRIEKAAVPDDIGINRVFEAIRIAGAVKSLVFMPREIDPEVSPASWRVGAVAGGEAGKGQQEGEKGG